MHARANNVTVEVEDDNEDVDNPVILQVSNSTFVQQQYMQKHEMSLQRKRNSRGSASVHA